MLTEAYDAQMGLAVWVCAGWRLSPDDLQRYIDGMTRLDESRASSSLSGILVMTSGIAPPNAVWRGRLVDAAFHLRSDWHVAVVAESAALRAVLTALFRLRPPPFDHTVEPTFGAAVRWSETQRGASLPTFTDLLWRAQISAPDHGAALVH